MNTNELGNITVTIDGHRYEIKKVEALSETKEVMKRESIIFN